MRHENVIPAEDHRRRLRAASYTMLVVVLVVVLAAIVVGPGRVIDLVGAYLTPVVVVLGVISRGVRPRRVGDRQAPRQAQAALG